MSQLSFKVITKDLKKWLLETKMKLGTIIDNMMKYIWYIKNEVEFTRYNEMT